MPDAGGVLLSSFRIENYRIFRQLSLPRLGQVNLVVGKNNTGKTMLLEALRLYSAQGARSVITELLASRDALERRGRSDGWAWARFESLFHGRQVASPEAFIALGTVEGSERSLLLRPTPLVRRGEGWGPVQGTEVGVQVVDGGHGIGLSIAQSDRRASVMGPEMMLGPGLGFGGRWDPEEGEESAFVPATGLAPEGIFGWWDKVALTDGEARIIALLKVVAPVERISVIGGPAGFGERTVVVRLEGEKEPVPLRSLGVGARKMFGFALALEAARGSRLLLIDEIENGIHYGAHETLWRFLIGAALGSGVQVVATTHSWDCVMGFQAALAAHPEVDAAAIRLYQGKEQIEAVVLDREEIAVATRDQWGWWDADGARPMR